MEQFLDKLTNIDSEVLQLLLPVLQKKIAREIIPGESYIPVTEK
jgi:CDP-6-deoxy-D-xylo-4-hexulose-3-dehydrase